MAASLFASTAATLSSAVGVFHNWRGFGEGLDDTPEAGWIVGEQHWGKGYAVEAMGAALTWFDAVHAKARIACLIAEENKRSLSLATRLGFSVYGRAEYEGDAVLLLERARSAPA